MASPSDGRVPAAQEQLQQQKSQTRGSGSAMWAAGGVLETTAADGPSGPLSPATGAGTSRGAT